MDASNHFWTIFNVRFNFLGKLCASVPADPKIRDAWLAARQPKSKPPDSRSIQEIQEELAATIIEEEGAEEEQRGLLVFQRVNGNLVLRASTFRSHIKDCARILSSLYVGKITGQRSFSSRILNCVYHDENSYWIPILKNGVPITDADGTYDKAVHARMRDGSMVNSIKTFEYVIQPEVSLDLKILGKSVSMQDLEHVFMYGAVHGYGGERGDGEGRYRFQITKKEETENGGK